MNDRQGKHWFRNLFLTPLALLLIGVVLSTAALWWDKPVTEMSYIIGTPAAYPGQLEVNGDSVDEITGYVVELWNSGDEPINNVPVQLVFDGVAEGFRILAVAHETEPKHEFGRITQSLESASIRLVFDLLNPGDRVTVKILANSIEALEVFAKAEGLRVKEWR